MSIGTLLLILLLGAGIGAAAAGWRFSRRHAELSGQLAEARADVAAAEARLESERQGHEKQVSGLTRLRDEIETKLAALSSKALKENEESFLRLAGERFDRQHESAQKDLGTRQQGIEALLKPLGNRLSEFERQVRELETKREGAYRAVLHEVKSLAEGQSQLSDETGKLAKALRRPDVRGRWGEMRLRRVLEMAGLLDHVDFEEQVTLATESGPLRPDVIVRLPGGRSLVVDAKTPLDAYLDTVEAGDDAARREAVARHVRQIHNHIDQLSSKEYWKQLPDTPDFVVMFIPAESLLAVAAETDRGLFERAFQKGVLISTPTTLIALAKSVAHGWRQQQATKEARAVADAGERLHKRLATFARHLEAVGKNLGRAMEHHNRSIGSFEQMLLPAARKFEELKVVPAGSEIASVPPREEAVRPLSALPAERMLPANGETPTA